MNMAIYYCDLPPVDDMLYVNPTSDDIEVGNIVKRWRKSKIDVFVVIGVDDEQIRTLYKNVRCRADQIEGIIQEFSEKHKKDIFPNICLKRLFRFDTAASAGHFLSYLLSFSEENFGRKDYYEEFMVDRVTISYGEPWVYAPELTEDDWKPGGVFYEAYGDYCVVTIETKDKRGVLYSTIDRW